MCKQRGGAEEAEKDHERERKEQAERERPRASDRSKEASKMRAQVAKAFGSRDAVGSLSEAALVECWVHQTLSQTPEGKGGNGVGGRVDPCLKSSNYWILTLRVTFISIFLQRLPIFHFNDFTPSLIRLNEYFL